jgi:hypothetical protein
MCRVCGAGVTVSFRLRGPVALTVVLLVCWAAATATLFMLPVVWRPDKFAVPFSPVTPAMGMFATVFLIGDKPPCSGVPAGCAQIPAACRRMELHGL